MTLTAFVEVGARDTNRLVVPFTGVTSGAATSFDETYDCPFPAGENRLNPPVHAVEKLEQ